MPEQAIRMLKDLGVSRESSAPEGILDKSKKFYPSLHLESNELEGIEDYDVGEKLYLFFEASVTGKSSSQRNGDRAEKISIDLELKKGMIYRTGDRKKMDETGMSKNMLAKAKGKKGMYAE